MSLSTRLSRLEVALPRPDPRERTRELVLRQLREPECFAVMMRRREAQRQQQHALAAELGAELQRLLGCSDAEWERLEGQKDWVLDKTKNAARAS